MKRCPECRRDYYDDTLLYCLNDGTELVYGLSPDESATAVLSVPPAVAGLLLLPTAETDAKTAILQPPATAGGSDSIEKRSFSARQAKPLAASILAIVFLLGGFFGYRYFAPSNSKQIESIAVMPFVNESGNADVEYLSDGMTETLIKSLAQIASLNVKPRSSVFRYKGKDTDLKTIGKELNVEAILNGRVVQRGDELTLSLELIDVAKERVIWTERYNRKQADLVTLQSEIARDVSANLQAKLSGAEDQKITRSYTDNADAYQRYLKGRYHWNKRTSDDLEKAVDHFNAAIGKDDKFALAYSGLADTYSVLPYYQGSRSAEFINKATPFAVRAVELDDKLAEAHSSLAFVNEGSWKWAEAERGYQRALDLNPNYASALLRFARFTVRVPKRDEDGLKMLKRSIEIEPSLPVVNDNLSQMYLAQGKPDLALVQAKKTVELDANFSFGWINLAYAQLKTGQIADARFSAEKVVEVTKRSSRSLICLGVVAAGSGRAEEARIILKELDKRYAERQADATDVAALHLALNDKEQAFVWLDKAFADHSSLLVDLRAEYPFASILDDSRYKDLRKRMNLPE